MAPEGWVDVSETLSAGVYALVYRGTVVYVGKAKRMLSRIETHRQVWAQRRRGKISWLAVARSVQGVMFDEVWVRRCRVEDLDSLEREMIARYQPRHNTLLKGNAPMSVVIAGRELWIGSPTAQRAVDQVVRRRI